MLVAVEPPRFPARRGLCHHAGVCAPGPRASFDGLIAAGIRLQTIRPSSKRRGTGFSGPSSFRAKRCCAGEPRARVPPKRRNRAPRPLLRTVPGELTLPAAVPRVRRLSGGPFVDRFGRNHLPPDRGRSRRRALDRAALEPTRGAWSAARVQAEGPTDSARVRHRRRRLAPCARGGCRDLRSADRDALGRRHRVSSPPPSFLGRTSGSGSRSGVPETSLSRRNLPAPCSRCRSCSTSTSPWRARSSHLSSRRPW